jgi:hypothetical protein
MNVENGKIVTPEQLKAMSEALQVKHVPIMRDLTKLEKATMQIRLYSPCGCGSGKKFKFCCYKPASP